MYVTSACVKDAVLPWCFNTILIAALTICTWRVPVSKMLCYPGALNTILIAALTICRWRVPVSKMLCHPGFNTIQIAALSNYMYMTSACVRCCVTLVLWHHSELFSCLLFFESRFLFSFGKWQVHHNVFNIIWWHCLLFHRPPYHNNIKRSMRTSLHFPPTTSSISTNLYFPLFTPSLVYLCWRAMKLTSIYTTAPSKRWFQSVFSAQQPSDNVFLSKI
jgi:hypothetical protein